MSESSAIDVLVQGAHVLARGRDIGSILDGLLAGVGAATGSASGAIFVKDGSSGQLTIAASLDLGEEAASGLTAAVRNPEHAVARTAATGETAFDVLPGAPGGPALRAHVPLIVARDGGEQVVGVLALAYDRPMDSVLHPLVLAVADLAAVSIDDSEFNPRIR
ncbi:MAG: hypothetical protein E6K80_14505 [Candidatus Eisenbacteria bacterium]|uniref:GAF domain-containing protein n=1 Tax=Eiseniibacteriota bacterium TaxID=2212470 RepID=A0A538TWX2_UNCEI|nr:MAG: hypothetical protein E6K80_14505 [Candidatus Eisenbacteria bacterium]